MYVLGPPGSGAGVVSGALQRLGLSDPAENSTTPDTHASPAGVNEALLAHLGGTRSAPPRIRPDWWLDPSLAGLRERGAECLGVWSERRPHSWFDSSNCLLLPYWRELILRPSAAVVVCRDPLDTVAELRRRGIDTLQALAMWDRYQRGALTAPRGLPSMVVEISDAMTDPIGLVEELAEFLGSLGGVPGGKPAIDAAADFLKSEVGDQALAGSGAADEPAAPLQSTRAREAILPDQAALWDAVSGLHGAAPVWSGADLGDESPWVDSLLEARRRIEALRGETRSYDRALSWAMDRLEELIPRTDEDDEAEPVPLTAAQDHERYRDWLAERQAESGPPGPPGSHPVPGGPKITVVVPVYKPRPWFLKSCIESVLSQTYPGWELCICDDGSNDAHVSALLAAAERRDPRIRVATLESNSGISSATNTAIALGTGAFVAFLDHDDELAPEALARVAEAIVDRPDADVVYSDEDKLDELSDRCQPTFKPDWSPDWLMSTAYICHLFVVRRSLVDEIGGLRPDFDGSQDYDLMLRSTERARSVVHIPEVLYHWRMVAGSAAEDSRAKPWAHEASRRAVAAALQRRGEPGRVDDGPYVGIYNVRRVVRGNPLVSALVPFRNEASLLRSCVESIRSLAGYDNVEIVLADNDSDDPETGALLEQLREDPAVKTIRSPGTFNWSKINNEAVAASRGDFLLFLNNDVEGKSQDWLLAMLEHAQRPEVGAVGARLLYPDGSVQHAGVVVGMYGKTGHVAQGVPGYDPGYMGMTKLTRNLSAVTGACMMTRRDVFERLGGFDEQMAAGYGDIDYCLKVRGAGYLVVYTPVAELLHAESYSRGAFEDDDEFEPFSRRWGRRVEDVDPYFNPNLSRHSPYCELPIENEEREWYGK